MNKKNLTTRELALYLHTTVDEVRKARVEPGAEGLEAKAKDMPASEEDSNAWYCRERTDGKQYSIEVEGQKYCTLQKKCIYQVQNGHKAKKCVYKPK